MKSIFLSIKNLIPYLLLVVIYFFFVNIEAKKNYNLKKRTEIEKYKDLNESNKNKIDSLIIIPVIPYKK
tara:strand:+ start:1115 stop:1321 length:207 start_codon:yes stop_codon:yes gene_type:complete